MDAQVMGLGKRECYGKWLPANSRKSPSDIGATVASADKSVLLLPVSAIMVLMQGLEPHPTVRSDHHRTIRL